LQEDKKTLSGRISELKEEINNQIEEISDLNEKSGMLELEL
jgi:hypothetical protein